MRPFIVIRKDGYRNRIQAVSHTHAWNIAHSRWGSGVSTVVDSAYYVKRLVEAGTGRVLRV